MEEAPNAHDNLHNRRRQIIVNRPVQGRIILNVSWPPAVALAVTVLLLGVFSTRLLDEALIAQVELPSLIPILLTVIGFMVVAVAYLFFNALTFSHRIAGPMYRLRRTLEAARSGDYSVRANLRSRDFLVEVADELNEFLATLEKSQEGKTSADEQPSSAAAATEAAADQHGKLVDEAAEAPSTTAAAGTSETAD